jgi:hypothetical protein
MWVGSVMDVSEIYAALFFRVDVNRASGCVYACTTYRLRNKIDIKENKKLIGRLNDAEEEMYRRETGCNEMETQRGS